MRVYQKNAISVSLLLNVQDCARCGVVFAIDDEFEDRLRQSGKTFYCPNGHTMTYGESALDKAKKELLQQKARADQLQAQRDAARRDRDAVERRLSATRGQVTKLRKRIHAGVCPYGCRRHFENLQRHIETKHKDVLLEGEIGGES